MHTAHVSKPEFTNLYNEFIACLWHIINSQKMIVIAAVIVADRRKETQKGLQCIYSHKFGASDILQNS